MRKVIQLTGGSDGVPALALCDDGSTWRLKFRTTEQGLVNSWGVYEWVRIPDVPQSEEATL